MKPVNLSRRSLIAAIPAVVGSSAAAIALPMYELGKNETYDLTLLGTTIAGGYYYQAHEALPHIRVGDYLTLRRQPNNPHDDMAIEILTKDGLKLGYVPSGFNIPFAQLLDAGESVRAKITEFNGVSWGSILYDLILTVRGHT